jgi:hypothetical protein
LEERIRISGHRRHFLDARWAIAEWKADPLVRRGRLTVGCIMELLRCSEELPSLEFTHEPMLMMWGTDDKVVTLAGH